MEDSKGPVVIMALLMVGIGIALSLCLASFAIQQGGAPPAPATPTEDLTAVPTEVAALLISLDDIGVPRPELEWLAVVKFTAGINQYYVVMVSADTQVVTAGTATPPKSIKSFYSDEIRKQRQARVIRAALGQISPGLGNTYVDISFDRRAINETIGLLGQYECQGRPQTGAEMSLQLDALPPAAAEDRLRLQAELLNCLFTSAQKQGWDFATLMDRLGRNFYPTRDHAAAYFRSAPPLAQSEIHFTNAPLVPTPTATVTP